MVAADTGDAKENATEIAVDRFAKQNDLKPEEKYILKYITKQDIKISSQPGGPDFSALGEANTVKTQAGLLGLDVDELKFRQSAIGVTTRKALETASSRIVARMIRKRKFDN